MFPNFITSALFGMITVEVTPEQLFSVSDKLLNDASTIKREFESIKGIIRSTSSYWQGAVSDSERKYYDCKYDDIVEMIERINNYASELKLIAQNYLDSEKTSTEEAQSLPTNVLS